ncbi:gp45 sliding clamp [Acinetobacter phage Ac42]|uniref:DNA polymerase processivity factor n=1 Tax=Acinetobacter phage Ac42 TaxID=762660 RepID=UPI0001EBCCFE|nr:DNA polymerase processivity factor [Acinetobacter phage Ac42]ADI96338.1 gp45 sliding clamp [Acinetobacter phage Ac42]
MRLSKETQAILKNFSTINSSIKLTPGKFIMTCNLGRTIHASAQIEDEIDIDAGIFDLPGFLTLLGLVDENAEISLTEDGSKFAIKGPRSVVYWPSADPAGLTYPKNTINFPAPTVEFMLKSDTWNQLTRVSRALGVDVIAFNNRDGEVHVDGFNKQADSAFVRPLLSLNLGDAGTTTDFNFILNMANLKLLVDDYKVKIFAKGASMASCFEGSTVHVIAVEKSSTHGFN